jgi:hypothetical protein
MLTGFVFTAAMHLLDAPGATPSYSMVPLRVSPVPHLPALALAGYSALLAVTAMRGHTLVNALLCGITFGLGLGLSGMTSPQKVSGFLDITGLGGAWDPSLAFVMGGGLLGSAIGCVSTAARHSSLGC